MAGENQSTVLRGIERIFNQGSLTGLSGGQLLRQFAAGDEGAFEALVSRHGPMVRGVCRRLLDDSRDVEDAFQATFLVLLRKAGGLRDPEALGPWLYGVAYRVASRIRARAGPALGRGTQGRPAPVRATRSRAGTRRAAVVDRRGDPPAAGEVSPAGGALLPRGADARGGGAPAAVHDGERARAARPGPGEATRPADPPRAGAGRRAGRPGRGRRVGIGGGPGPARRRDGRHPRPRRDGYGGLGRGVGLGDRAGRRRVPGDDGGEAQGGGVLPGRRRNHPGRGRGLAHGPRRLIRRGWPRGARTGRVAGRRAGRRAPGSRGRACRSLDRNPHGGPADREALAGRRADGARRSEAGPAVDDGRRGARRGRGPRSVAKVPVGGRPQGRVRPDRALVPEPDRRG